ncbi:MAG: hypothetical protein Q8O19_05370 [Rectinemataceae bacterium]|nr:hypothetical protein [Rectinemataceae bacterium]
MGWIIVLFCIVLVIVLTRKTLDRETTGNLKLLGKMLAAVVAIIVLWGFLSYTSH